MSDKLIFTDSERRIFAKREMVSCADWASRHLIVQDGMYRNAPLRLDVSPFLAGPMRAYSDPRVREVVVCGSLQVGKTLFLYACLGWAMDFRPGVKMLAMPTKDALARVVDKKLRPLLQGSPRLRRLIAKYRAANIVLKDGTSVELASAESPSQRASITVQDLFLDEEDLYAGAGQSSALEDFKGRTRSFGEFAKVVRACQPKGGEDSSIWQGITRQVDQLFCYEFTCPACGRSHLPDMSNLVITGDEKDPRLIRTRKLARYKCPECQWLWTDHVRDVAVAKGGWKPYVWTGSAFERTEHNPDAVSVGFHMPAVLSRFVSLSDLASRRLLADESDDPEVRRQYANDDLAIPYVPTELETDSDRLAQLVDSTLPPRTVPHGAIALTCGVDVQKRGFWYVVRAWMPSLASYIIDYGYLESWEHVTSLVFDTYYPVQGPGEHAGEDTGERMAIWRGAIDSGGTETEGVFTRTEEVYLWVRQYGGGIMYAVKGASRAQNVPVRQTIRERMPHNGRPIPGGLRLYMLDTGHFKTLDFSRMLNEASKQPLRFHSGCDATLFDQLAAERQIRKRGQLVWEQVAKDNHLLDCLMMSAACADVSWTPSLPLYALQIRLQENGDGQEIVRRKKKKRENNNEYDRW